jgi:hypothetical protein
MPPRLAALTLARSGFHQAGYEQHKVAVRGLYQSGTSTG